VSAGSPAIVVMEVILVTVVADPHSRCPFDAEKRAEVKEI
jgi:hypothetical protein